MYCENCCMGDSHCISACTRIILENHLSRCVNRWDSSTSCRLCSRCVHRNGDRKVSSIQTLRHDKHSSEQFHRDFLHDSCVIHSSTGLTQSILDYLCKNAHLLLRNIPHRLHYWALKNACVKRLELCIIKQEFMIWGRHSKCQEI